MYIRFMWQKELFKLYRDKNGRPHSYATALHDLATINQQIEERTFDPKEWLPAAIQERRFETAMDNWIFRKEKEADEGKLAPSTLGNYKTYRSRYYLTSRHLSGQDVRDIRLKHLQLFYDELTGSAKYRKNVMDGLYTFFRWLKRWGEIKEVPTWPEIEAPIQHEPFTLVEDAQIDVLSRIPEKHRDIFEFLMETGLRPSEACALMAKDIDPHTRKALIRRTYSEASCGKRRSRRRKDGWCLRTGLGNSSPKTSAGASSSSPTLKQNVAIDTNSSIAYGLRQELRSASTRAQGIAWERSSATQACPSRTSRKF